MDPNFKWTTRDQKLDVVRYWWREQRAICHLCKDRENPMEPYEQAGVSPWAASIEHLVPKRDNGPDTVGNVRLAHRWCNNVLGALWKQNQDRAVLGLELISEHWALNNKRAQLNAVRQELRTEHKVFKKPFPDRVESAAARHELKKNLVAFRDKPARGTLAYMVENDQMPKPRGATLPKLAEGSTLEQLAVIDWPWLRRLITPRVELCGFGPWKT